MIRQALVSEFSLFLHDFFKGVFATKKEVFSVLHLDPCVKFKIKAVVNVVQIRFTHWMTKSDFFFCGTRENIVNLHDSIRFIMHPPQGPKGRGVADRQRGGALVFYGDLYT